MPRGPYVAAKGQSEKKLSVSKCRLVCPRNRTSIDCLVMSQKGHVWTAPDWQEESSRRRLGWCSHAFIAVYVTAGQNALHRSGPGQNSHSTMRWRRLATIPITSPVTELVCAGRVISEIGHCMARQDLATFSNFTRQVKCPSSAVLDRAVALLFQVISGGVLCGLDH
jgi:hypothetical protein